MLLLTQSVTDKWVTAASSQTRQLNLNFDFKLTLSLPFRV